VSTADVLVVGAGPTGLTTACTLLAAGVPCRIVDQRRCSSSAPKALVLWSGCLEVLRRLGVADDVTEQALPLGGASYWSGGRRIGSMTFGSLAGTAFPRPLCLPQPAVERILTARLARLGGAVEWGVQLLDARIGPDGAVARLRHPDGREEQAATEWLLGADGTRSRVRAALGLAFDGSMYDRTFLLGDGVVRGGATQETQYHLTPDGVLVVVPLPGGGHRVFFDTAPDDRAAPPDSAELQALLDARGPGHLVLETVWWSSRFQVSTKVAAGFRRGRGFVAGDAAHCHSPAGGQGLNTGVQDGYDLGWKLATVLRGGPVDLLDSYEAERRAVALDVVRIADRQTRLWLLRSAVARRIRDVALGTLSRRGLLERRIVPQLAQHDLDLSSSPAVGDLPGGSAAPQAVRLGHRFPDAAVEPVAGTSATTVHEYLAHCAAGRHVLVLAGADEPLVARAAQAIASRGVSDVVAVLHLAPARPGGASTAPTSPAPPAALVRDRDSVFSTGRPWLAHVRPDGVVGARCGPAELDGLLHRLPQARRRTAPHDQLPDSAPATERS
jgi:2-polyprenyl-6-methoxyphenol hydroxylase-like FAD-dependent oxidoreductase